MAQTEVLRIRDQLHRAIEGEAWHGPALKEVIGTLTPREAAARPLPGGHSPWEIIVHVVVWIETVHRRLQGQAVTLSAAEDWPTLTDTGASAWAALGGRLDRAHDAMQRMLAQMRDEDLGEPVPGQSFDRHFMLQGVIQHISYHGGQISVLRKTPGEAPSG